MFLALLLSGFFRRRRWWIKALLPIYVLPWLIAAAQACVSFHWMLIPQYGLVDGLWAALFGVDGPYWFGDRWLALGCNIAAYTWKWMPFWTVIFLAGRMTIPQDIYDAAEVDGATGLRRFVHITWPLLANLYLICTSLFRAVGDRRLYHGLSRLVRGAGDVEARCWRRSAFAMRSILPPRSSGSPRRCRPCRS